MARNPVQFQKGISLNAFLSLYGTEDQCFDALYQGVPDYAHSPARART